MLTFEILYIFFRRHFSSKFKGCLSFFPRIFLCLSVSRSFFLYRASISQRSPWTSDDEGNRPGIPSFPTNPGFFVGNSKDDYLKPCESQFQNFLKILELNSTESKRDDGAVVNLKHQSWPRDSYVSKDVFFSVDEVHRLSLNCMYNAKDREWAKFKRNSVDEEGKFSFSRCLFQPSFYAFPLYTYMDVVEIFDCVPLPYMVLAYLNFFVFLFFKFIYSVCDDQFLLIWKIFVFFTSIICKMVFEMVKYIP